MGHAVKTMTVTQTRYGVTLRHVLMAIGSDEIYSLDKRFADPRAPKEKPAKLESVCHVFGIGLDIFYTRTTPSQKFDLLSDDFDYLALIAAMTAMFTATMTAWHVSNQRDLQSAWR